MKIVLSDRASIAIADAPRPVRKAFHKQLAFLERDLHHPSLRANLHHPSLRAKKYDEARDIWQARVNKDWRFYFKIVDDAYVIRDVVPHPK
jgi:plasmid maintenance system killer protein